MKVDKGKVPSNFHHRFKGVITFGSVPVEAGAALLVGTVLVESGGPVVYSAELQVADSSFYP